jgi:phage terminase small subunit
MSLNVRQARFVEEYLLDLNAKQAAIRAGYSEKTAEAQGSRLLTHVEVAKAIAAARVDRTGRTEVDQDYVVVNLVEIVERCMQRAPVMVGHGENRMQLMDDGKSVWTFNAKDAVAALKILAKHTGGFSDKVDIVGSLSGVLEVVVKETIVDPKNRISHAMNGNGANGRAGT